MGKVPAVRLLETVGRGFARPEVWAYLGFGAFSGHALGRFAKAVVPWAALFYLGAFLSGLNGGLLLGLGLGVLSGLSDR